MTPICWTNNLDLFLSAARKRPEIAQISSTFLPHVPQVYVDVDLERTLKQGVAISGRLRNHSDLHGRHFYQLLQSLRTGLAGLRTS